jgi:oligopeptide transport system substrate-binding protein
VKRTKIAVSGIALLSVAALALAGCSSNGGGTDNPSSGSSADGGTSTGDMIIKTNGSEPQNSLIPANTNEVGGGKILDSLFAGLVYYDADGKPVNDMAQEIKQDDAQNLTVTLKKGQKFSDGTEVKADNFIKAWNDGAKFSNGYTSSYFFEDIEGYDGAADSELTGLVKVDDYTFTIKLNKPASDFALRLGYSAFYPLPDSAFDDMAKFAEAPIGNGPYKLAGDDAWQHDVSISLVKNETYEGGRAAKNDGLDIVFYQTADAAYSDLLGGNVDVIDQIPGSSFATFESELGDRAVNQPAAIFQSFTIPGRLEHFSGEEGKLRRAAISMAIDRAEITKTIFNGTRTPADDFTSPVIADRPTDLTGADVLEFNPTKAKELWAQADAISPWSGSFQIGYNGDSSHGEWVDAVSNQLKNNLGIEASGNAVPTFSDFRKQVTDRAIQTAFRTGWQADYPGVYNFLGPLYSSAAADGKGSNDGDYKSPEFDAALTAAISATDAAAAKDGFKKAEEILLADLPAIPLWYSNVTGGYAEGVQNVQFGWNSVPLFYEITK